MKKRTEFWSANLKTPGRVVRGLGALGLLGGAYFTWQVHWVLGVVLGIAGLFVLYEALRGWCLLRACGLRTRI